MELDINTKEVATELDEGVLRSFVWSVYNFFTICTGEDPEIEVPYLYEGMDHREYTGAIGVSGNHKGAIYLTLNDDMLESLLEVHCAQNLDQNAQTPEEYEELKLDYAGEIINIISGNARNYLGENFLISVPIVINAPNTSLHLTQKGCGIVFPIKWQGMQCTLILNLSTSKQQAEGILENMQS